MDGSSHPNHENRRYESSPPQGPSRGTAGQITGFFYEYGNLGRRGAPFGAAAFIANI